MSYTMTPAARVRAEVPRHVLIRHSNGGRMRRIDGLGFVEAIPAIISAIAAVGTAGYGIYAADADKKDAKKAASKAEKQAAADAAAAAAEQKRVDDATLAQAQQQTNAKVAATKSTSKALSVWIPVSVGGVLVLGTLIAWRMRRGKKR